MKFSAVVNCFNEELYVYYSLKSIYGYTDEIIVVDNCSSDSTVDIVNQFIRSEDLENKVKLYALEEPMQLGDVRNFALGKAKNDWVIKWDGDFCAFGEMDVENEKQAPFSKLLKVVESKKNDYDIFLLHSLNISGDLYHYDKSRARLGLNGDSFVGRKDCMSYGVTEKYGDVGILKRKNGEKAKLFYLNNPEKDPMYFIHIYGVKPDSYLLYRRFLSEYQVWVAKNKNRIKDFWEWLGQERNYNIDGGVSYVKKEIVKNMLKHDLYLPKILQPEIEQPKYLVRYENDIPVSRESLV
ncbi:MULTISPECIES: glycosyltransferase family 2 protein [unclassified Endozoicomonas]|uniref:glycosyltransferase family 2 protein n=1 Tax=unclassified Endozoicomonas TaxID=2644528 RepID=UPI003BB6A5D6